MYNPNNPLSNGEIEKLNDYELFEYLDSKSKHMEKFSAPLSGYKLKRYAYTSAAIGGGKISEEHHKELGKMGKENFNKVCEIVKNKLASE
jgi:hypothetical protein